MGLVNQILTWLIAFTSMGLMLITTTDVVGRYIFNSPLTGSTELTEFFLGILIFLAIPMIFEKNSHITVELLEAKFSPGFKKTRNLLEQVVWMITLGLLSYAIFLLGIRAKNDLIVSETLELPVYVFDYITALLILLSIAYNLRYVIRCSSSPGTRKSGPTNGESI